MNEFELIGRLIDRFGELTRGEFVEVGPGDDAAVLNVSANEQLVVTTDTLVPGVHFPANTRGDLVGYRTVAINVSDLAAMGANPRCMTVALTVEFIDNEWIEALAFGMSVAAHEFDLKIVGGNLARGALNISATVHGAVPHGKALLRSGAQANDDIWVTGTLGATCEFLRNPVIPHERLEAILARRDSCALARYFLPHPRVDFAVRMRDIANAAIDISDGLTSEVVHLTSASSCGAQIVLDRLPMWPTLEPLTVIGPDDSYELLFTASKQDRSRVLATASATHTPVVALGQIVGGREVSFMLDGKDQTPRLGYDHFA